MLDSESLKQQPSEISADPPSLRHWIMRPGVLILIGGVAVAAGLASSWNWFAAVGLAPIIIALLPCAAMCALGICIAGKKR